MNIHEQYNEMIVPENFVQNFSDMDAFRDWLTKGDLSDLLETRKAFEKSEMYEYLDAIQAQIDVRVDGYLEGMGFEID